LSYAAGLIEKNGYQIKIVDSCAEGYDRVKSLELIAEFKPALVVLDTSTPSISNDLEVGSLIKEKLGDVLIVLVGTHPSALAEEVLKLSKKIDAVAVGEYEHTILELANLLTRGKLSLDNKKEVLSEVAGLSFRFGDEIIHNKPRALIEDLNSLPFVSEVYKKHLNVKKYFYSAGLYPMIMIRTGRGCPWRCYYCLYPQVMSSHKLRSRTPENIVAEFEYIVKEIPSVKGVIIDDDTFGIDKAHARQVCRLLIEKRINKKIKWWVNTRVDTLDLATMKLMKQAGCRLLLVGFESGSQLILDNIAKGATVEQAKKFAKAAKKAGLIVHGCFMVGNPGETKKTLKETLDLALELDIDTAQFFPLIVYPGTRAFEWAKKNGFLSTDNYRQWLTPQGLHNTIINTKEFTAKDLIGFCNYARRKFYLRPKYIFYKAWQSLLRPREMKRNIVAASKLLPHLLKKEEF